MDTLTLDLSRLTHEEVEGCLPDGVAIVPLEHNRDQRGEFTEIFRASWLDGFEAIQWNLVRSEGGVLRGVHVHLEHSDYLVVAGGHCLFGLFDCRSGSPSGRRSALVAARGLAPFGLVIPPGVAHGFYFEKPSLHIYAVTSYWDGADELGCRFDDPALGIKWPNPAPILSQRDRELPPLADVLPLIPEWREAQGR